MSLSADEREPRQWRWIPSPNHYRGRQRIPIDLLVVHYTAGRGDEVATARVFASPSREASAHFVVGRTGGIVQCVDLDDAAWHAGDGGKARVPSGEQLEAGRLVTLGEVQPRARVNNLRSIGIEVCNRGWAPRGRNPYAAADHRNPASHSTSWESYSLPQLDALRKLVAELVQQIPTLRYVTGHEDCTHADTLGAPGAKLDPGPLFPWRCLADLGLTRVLYDFAAHGWRTEAL